MRTLRTAAITSFTGRLIVICGAIAMLVDGPVELVAHAAQTAQPPPTDPKPAPSKPKPPEKDPVLPQLPPPCGPTKSCPGDRLDQGSALLVLEGCLDYRETATMLDVGAKDETPATKYKLQLPSTFDVSAMRGSMVSLSGVLSEAAVAQPASATSPATSGTEPPLNAAGTLVVSQLPKVLGKKCVPTP
jgi:hypothetical protein